MQKQQRRKNVIVDRKPMLKPTWVLDNILLRVYTPLHLIQRDYVYYTFSSYICFIKTRPAWYQIHSVTFVKCHRVTRKGCFQITLFCLKIIIWIFYFHLRGPEMVISITYLFYVLNAFRHLDIQCGYTVQFFEMAWRRLYVISPHVCKSTSQIQ